MNNNIELKISPRTIAEVSVRLHVNRVMPDCDTNDKPKLK